MENTIGMARTSFRGDLGGMVGLSEFEVTRADVDTALARFDIQAPSWLRNLFPGVRIDIEGEIQRQLSRPVYSSRFFARYAFVGASFTVSSPRLTEPLESRKLGNQITTARLSMGGDVEALSLHLAEMAISDETKVKPFFSQRYDVEVWVQLKRLFLKDRLIASWGNERRRKTIDFEVTTGVRYTADPSPVLDLGNLLFISEHLDDLMEGGLLAPLEGTTDRIAVAIQNVAFGKFRDPRVVPSMGWYLRGELPVNFGGDLSFMVGGEFSSNWHTAINGTRPMYSMHAFTGLRWRMLGLGYGSGASKGKAKARKKR